MKQQQSVTDEQIEALRSEAAAAGDLEQVRLCDRALRGSGPAREACEDAILAARAMDDGR